jgi:hypothetical protein
MKANNQHKRSSNGWALNTVVEGVEVAPVAKVEDLEQRRMMSAVTFNEGV